VLGKGVKVKFDSPSFLVPLLAGVMVVVKLASVEVILVEIVLVEDVAGDVKQLLLSNLKDGTSQRITMQLFNSIIVPFSMISFKLIVKLNLVGIPLIILIMYPLRGKE